jgi:hypothetical protein
MLYCPPYQSLCGCKFSELNIIVVVIIIATATASAAAARVVVLFELALFRRQH